MVPVTHAGGVVVRAEGGISYLLVPAKDKPEQMVFPKGHIEPGETAMAAAVREVREEAGVEAGISADLGTVEITVGDSSFCISFYLMEFLKDVDSDQKRPVRWLSYGEALTALTFEESRGLLHRAYAVLKKRNEL